MEILFRMLSVLKSNIPAVTVVVSVALAFIGYAVTYTNARVLARKKDRLDLINKRLNDFYGPLYVANRAGRTAYYALMGKLGKKKALFESGYEPSKAELDEWFLWMRRVFIPLNDAQERIIMERAHLIVEEQMPECLIQFVIHVVGYKVLLAKWEAGDFTEKFPLVNFPSDFDDYVARSYADLKGQQTHLLESL